MNEQITQTWWVTPVATLIAALLGGMLPLITAIWIFERQGDRDNLSKLSSRSERLIQLIADTSKATRQVLSELDEHHTVAQKNRCMAPILEPVTDAKYVTIHMMNETTDELLRSSLSCLIDEIQIFDLALGHFMRITLPINGKLCPINDAYTSALTDIYFAHNKIDVRVSEVVERVAVLREAAEKKTLQRLRETIRNS